MTSKLTGYLVLVVLITGALLAGCDAGGLAPAAPTATPTAPPQPGVALILRMVPFDGDQAITPDLQEQARRVMEARAKEMGLTSAAVRSEEPDLLVVELRGKDSAEEIRRVLASNGFLEIVEGGDNPPVEGTIVVTSEGAPTIEEGEPKSLNPYKTIVTGRDILPDKVTSKADPASRQPQLTFTLNQGAAGKFSDYTTANVGKYLSIVLDKQVISSPRIAAPITTGECSVTGLSEDQARQVGALLKAGAMPTRLQLVETQQLGTSTNP